jgi:subtilase family serine protease
MSFNVGGRIYAANFAVQTIAIVIGSLDPAIGNGLKTFDRQYGLPDPIVTNRAYAGAQNNETVSAQIETAMDVE